MENAALREMVDTLQAEVAEVEAAIRQNSRYCITIAEPKAALVGAHQHLIPSSTGSATPSNAPSTSSNNGAGYPLWQWLYFLCLF